MRGAPRLVMNRRGIWEIRTAENGDVRKKSLRTRDHAEAAALFAQFLLNVEKRPTYTLAEAWTIREANSLSKVVDADRIRSCWKALLPELGHLKIGQLTQEHVDAYALKRAATAMPGTIRREISELKTTLLYMAKTRRVSPGDFAHITLPPDPSGRVRWLDADECQQVVQAARARRRRPEVPDRLELFLQIGMHTGQRKRAIETLEWSQVDFSRGMIHFGKPGERVTKKRKADIPMRDELHRLLELAYITRESDYVLGSPGCTRTSMENLMAKLELEDVTAHTLRHTFISHLLIKGVSTFTVSQITAVGVRVIEKTYGHLSVEHKRAALAL